MVDCFLNSVFVKMQAMVEIAFTKASLSFYRNLKVCYLLAQFRAAFSFSESVFFSLKTKEKNAYCKLSQTAFLYL